ncbi:MGH1-like glycoside hydrolase domain-containing protein [Sphingobacterium sp. LRF_L2]|uniref:MGH1-like glycoside hydrolase domain-containing protein n=1 Tax=Sphingobacterium sp. LRF_L2 TaxID=3369421 RepID=UPI003F6010E2
MINYTEKTRPSLLIFLVLYSLFLCTACSSNKYAIYNSELQRFEREARIGLNDAVDEFNSYEGRPISDGPFNATNNKDFLQKNVPLFISSNDTINKVYNYRWWMISKHLREYEDAIDQKKYWVVTEFFGFKPWASLSGAITCPAGHQFYDLRWLRDSKYLKSYADYFMSGSASRINQRENGNFLTYLSRPESHHFSSWMIDGIEAYLTIHPDTLWLREILPSMEKHQTIWDSLFTVKRVDSKTNGMYKILDLYDGMEFSLSAVLGLIESGGPYAIYTDETWRKLYLGWGTTDEVARSSQARQYPRAFRKGYPDFYLVRPSVNGYAYANLRSLSNLYDLLGQKVKKRDSSKSLYYADKAETLQRKVLDVLWNNDDVFFNSYSAGDNEFGVQDFEAKVRESVGYTPWYFNMIPDSSYQKYAKSWSMFASEKGFFHDKGMTTAERQHPYYNEQAYAWNGRGWPFQNSVVYKAFANYLKNYKKDVENSDRILLYNYIEKLAVMHGVDEPNIGEWYIPSVGESFGGEQDYFHSTFPDIIIADLLGFKGYHENKFSIETLLPYEEWDYFYLGKLSYHGHDVDIIWKKDWNDNAVGNQSRLCVWVDNKLVGSVEGLNEKIVIELNE